MLKLSTIHLAFNDRQIEFYPSIDGKNLSVRFGGKLEVIQTQTPLDEFLNLIVYAVEKVTGQHISYTEGIKFKPAAEFILEQLRLESESH